MHSFKRFFSFMTQAMGGPDVYCGKFPVPAHKHLYITAELFEMRSALLDEALREAGVADALRDRWLKIDGAFKGKLVKSSPLACEGRFRTEAVVVIEKPLR